MTNKEAIHYLENMKWLKGYDNTMIGDRPIPDIIDEIIEKLKNYEEMVNKYHLSCDHCGADWWSKDPFPEKCPFCEAERKWE